ncbi:TetR/AcrR family transcriptional regulator [Erwinia amylovora]|uniref:TetR-family transcriptional regulator n=2 Tax=Erwinia amylovora TaxID=552 RepID=A0A831EP29_ERWAM|nr:TetR/AcrR family transcriptional regulator [Erwinia amylovora]CDK14178.1 TetR-family transcriptional regulator [Erwinia amylovora LA635]CDK17545.1 TetR-family transcriptional regulator [Erwinia amylovora LA636]CDK20914.1 TetR-family transcriptional regulator [Erwinia amylovora LA637]AAX39463.1 unknown [Erwinia amylovora]ATZ12602.1 TetR/AcrR family transcriptional regulator [Erwinia amylovora]
MENEVNVEQRDSASILVLTRTRARTRHLLIDTAIRLFDSGAFPSITEVAHEAQLSRATAYRYFPTQSALVSAIVAATLSPMADWQPTHQDVIARINELLSFAFPHMLKHEGTLRAALHLSLTQWAQSQSADASPLKEKLVRGNREEILKLVTQPLSGELTPPLIDRVVRALSLIYGSEIFLVMKDVWGCDNDELQDIGKWVARAIVRQAREDVLATG